MTTGGFTGAAAAAEQPGLGFAELLRQLRAEAGLTQEELADVAGLSPRSVSAAIHVSNRTSMSRRKDSGPPAGTMVALILA